MKLLFVVVALLAATAYAQESEVAAPKETAGSATQSALNALQGGLKEHNEFSGHFFQISPHIDD